MNRERRNQEEKLQILKREKSIGEMQILPILFTFILLSSASGDLDDDDDAQNEFLLPYSETEDVDFHITRPAGSGCYQW